MLLPGIGTPSCNNWPRSFQSTIFFSRAVSIRDINCSALGIVATISLSVSFSSLLLCSFATFSSLPRQRVSVYWRTSWSSRYSVATSGCTNAPSRSRLCQVYRECLSFLYRGRIRSGHSVIVSGYATSPTVSDQPTLSSSRAPSKRLVDAAKV